jgi:hypothetical protein
LEFLIRRKAMRLQVLRRVLNGVALGAARRKVGDTGAEVEEAALGGKP